MTSDGPDAGDEPDRPEFDSVARVAVDEIPAAFERLEDMCGRWINDRSELFALFDVETLGEYHVRRKAFNELSLYLLVREALSARPVAPVGDVRTEVLQGTNDRRFHHAIMRNPVYVRWYGYPVLYTEEVGRLADRTTYDTIRDFLCREYVWGKDRIPSGTIELWHLAKSFRVTPPYEAEEILRTSCLTHELHPVLADLEDVYSLTHDLMFYHGFGMEGAGSPGGSSPYDVGRSLRALLLRFLADEKYDAVGELLLTGILQRQVPADLVGLCLHRLLEVVETNGYVPDYSVMHSDGGQINRRNAAELAHRGDRAVHWATQYHANIVVGIAALAGRTAWDGARAVPVGSERPEYDPANLLTLGSALAAFAEYNLRAGARSLQAVAGTDAVRAYPEIFELAVAFLDAQRRSDGSFGYWVDEQIEFASRGFDPETFDSCLVEPVTNACESALESIANESNR